MAWHVASILRSVGGGEAAPARGLASLPLEVPAEQGEQWFGGLRQPAVPVRGQMIQMFRKE